MADIKNFNGGTSISGEVGMKFFRMAQLKGALGLEVQGIRMSRGVSAYAIIKKEFGLKGNKQKVLEQFTKIVDDFKAKNHKTLYGKGS